MKISFSEFTKSNGNLTKVIGPDGQGGETSTVQTVNITFEEFGPYIRSLGKNQVIAHGIHEKQKGIEELCK